MGEVFDAFIKVIPNFYKMDDKMAVSWDAKISSKMDLNIASILVFSCSILAVYHSGTVGK